jgi:hypothetical protein
MKIRKFRGLSIRFDEGFVYGDVRFGKEKRSAHIYPTPGKTESIPVVRESVGLFTGYKDVNDAEVFEDDMVLYQRPYPMTTKSYGVIEQSESGSWVIRSNDNKITVLLGMFIKTVEVFGNVHEPHNLPSQKGLENGLRNKQD